MRRSLLASAVVVLVAGVVVSLAAGGPRASALTARWVVRDLGTLGGSNSIAEAVNDRGQVVGWSETAEKDDDGRFVVHAFLWEKGRMRDLGVLGRHDGVERSEAYALNERGQVVGVTSTRAQARRAFLWEKGRMRDLGSVSIEPFSADEFYSVATGINEGGLVVAEVGDAEEDLPLGGFVWEAGRVRRLPGDATPVAVNDRGQVLVEGSVAPLLWRNGNVRLLLAFDPGAFMVDLNDRGQVAATVSPLTGVPRAAIWTDGKVRQLGRIGARGCDAWDLNDRGAVAGVCRDGSKRDQPVVWNGQRPTRITTVWGDRGLATAVNDAGQVIGFSSRPGRGCKRHAFVWERGQTTDLGTLPGGGCASTDAISENGVIVGWATINTGDQHAVLWAKTG